MLRWPSADSWSWRGANARVLPGVSSARSWSLTTIGLVWAVGVGVILRAWLSPPDAVAVVTHWANIYMMDEPLLPTFAREFNAAGHRTGSGNQIEVRPYLVNSGVIVEELVSRIQTGRPSGSCYQARGGCPRRELGEELPEPTLVTPAADHWLSQVNHSTGRAVIDLPRSSGLASSHAGIVVLRDMARCLGWPDREVGIADIVALRQDPRGWGSCPGAKAEWGKVPLVSFTDPNSSSTARSILFTLYAIAAGKSAEQLTLDDVTRPSVVEYVRQFQRGVDHYVPDTVVLASKIYSGPRYGHIFFNLENQLVTLYQGKAPVIFGAETKPRPLEWDMVMIYPKEGATVHRHTAGLVEASWVKPEQGEAANRWIAFLREEPRQTALMNQGFRPGTNVPTSCPICPRFGVDPGGPRSVIEPSRVDPVAADRIVRSWGDVKKQGVLTFVVDNSGAMAGTRMLEAKEGVRRVLDRIDQRTLVGILTFSTAIHERIEPSPIAQRRYEVVEAVGRQVGRGSAVYDAIQEGIRMTAAAPSEPEAIRGVVVLTAGRATTGLALHDLVQLVSKSGSDVTRCSGFGGDAECLDEGDRRVATADVHATGWATDTRHPVHVFYVGIGDGADLEVGRLLAEATPGSSFEGTTEKDLANVIERFSTYF